MQIVGRVVASYLLVCFKSTRSTGLIGFALLMAFRPIVFLLFAVLTAAISAFIYLRKPKELHMIHTTNVIDAISMLPLDVPDEQIPDLLAERSRRYTTRAYV